MRVLERQGTEQIDAILPGHGRPAALPEDVLLVPAMPAGIHAHVLDHAEHRDLDLLEHLEGLAGIQQRDVLGGRHDHGPAHRDALAERQLDVAGAGREVHDQIIHVPPARVVQQLLQGRGDHGSAPDHRCLLVDEVADGDGLDAVAHERLEGFPVEGLGLALGAQHARLARAVDVRVEDRRLRPAGLQGEGEVHGHG